MKVLMGAPNVVRSGAHFGNVAAAGLAAEGLLDILVITGQPVAGGQDNQPGTRTSGGLQ